MEPSQEIEKDIRIDNEDDTEEIEDDAQEIDSDINSDSDSNIDEIDIEDISSKEKKVISSSNDYENFLEDDKSYYSDDMSSDDEDTEEYDKLDKSKDFLNDIHKNLQSINYIEIEKLSKVTRDENNIIIDEYHTTFPVLSKYEKTKILGVRTKQLNSGAVPFISISEDNIEGYVIAERELYEKKIPFIIKRPINYNQFEYWKLEDLEII